MKKILTGILIVVLLITTAFLITWKISRSRSFQFFGGIVERANTGEKVVALTFDDGPTERTEEILSILDALDVKATFFLIGSQIEKNPEEAKKIALAGHQLGNHTYSHKRMVFKSLSYIKEEIENTDSLIINAGYTGAIQFRPPNCKKLVLLPYYLKQHDRKTIIWDIEPETYPEIASSPDKIVEHVIDNAKPGSIILLHPMNKGNGIKAIEGIVKGLKEKGYTFKTVNELQEME